MKRSFGNFSAETSLLPTMRIKKKKLASLTSCTTEHHIHHQQQTNIVPIYPHIHHDAGSSIGWINQQHQTGILQISTTTQDQFLESICGFYHFIKPKLCECDSSTDSSNMCCCTAQCQWHQKFGKKKYTLSIYKNETLRNYSFEIIESNTVKEGNTEQITVIDGFVESESSNNSRKIILQIDRQTNYRALHNQCALMKFSEQKIDYRCEAKFFPNCNISNISRRMITFEIMNCRLYFGMV
ncbi:hypothetical protein C9374_012542 [Naegleria lovaniensis]|uniref:Uncharacterized protein n=1 Tax=Naegleria lovaniensis TaxID=51637 RepID=A0AA88KW35_NAELO|nr:uncharacterized protein C9374_012542 [Naegleria lovaniensis]KAG2392290.1 hypothetical protein C9374_012542 [Naegleria lovaniensis]